MLAASERQVPEAEYLAGRLPRKRLYRRSSELAVIDFPPQEGQLLLCCPGF
ncbi:MAG: hypothetical protein JRJ12_10185 [Deltaproteobacteria bacterium]|nr:hypothetical protein [Deltaproteobacteria bacterium]MBW2072266.1 hypothetical protein [Deltaproteobacteria bacterium]